MPKTQALSADTIKYKIYFDLTSNYPLKDFEFLDYLDDQSDNAHTDSKALPYISYDRESVGLYVKKDGESNHTPVSKTDYAVSWAKGNDTYETHWADLNNCASHSRYFSDELGALFF